MDISSWISELEAALRTGHLSLWYPATVAREGFFESLGQDWQPEETGVRTAVYQSRMTWMAATAARYQPEYLSFAEHGTSLLVAKFVLPGGAVPWSLGSDGAVLNRQQHAYASSFVLYALAAAARVLPQTGALSAAQAIFRYLEEGHRDRDNGGYWEVTDENGRPVVTGIGLDAIGTPFGQKSQNTHLHLLEAFTELYRVWPDPGLELALRHLIDLFVERLFVADGWLHMFVKGDWTPVPGSVSHGHDIEAVHLLLAAASVLPGGDSRVPKVAILLADYVLAHGVDSDGFVYNYGAPDGSVIDPEKVWWVQAEALLGLIAVHQSTKDDRYLGAAKELWSWIKKYMIDPDYGGWWETLDAENRPKSTRKAHAWKAAYHDGRALLFSVEILREIIDDRLTHPNP